MEMWRGQRGRGGSEAEVRECGLSWGLDPQPRAVKTKSACVSWSHTWSELQAAAESGTALPAYPAHFPPSSGANY